jgi:ATP-dependent DNA ligase
MSLPIPKTLKPMLAKLQREMPEGDGWLFEPKWDGFRAIVYRDGDEIDIISRDGKPLVRYFPELVPLVAASLPDRCVVDGEIVIAVDGRLDFDLLTQRIHPAESRVDLLSKTTPSSYVAFDLLAIEDRELLKVPMVERRAELAKVVPQILQKPPREKGSFLWLTPQTDDATLAEQWPEKLGHLGIEGVIAKQSDLTYRPNSRAMIKVKKQKTADCVVAGYRLSKSGDGIGSLLLGLYGDAGVLQYVGHTSSFKADERRRLLEELQPLRGESFGQGRTPGGQSRWSRGKEGDWVALRPELVCEVSFDRLQGDRFRHAATFVRWRDDRDPASCTFEQITD